MTLHRVRQPGLDATIVQRHGFREIHITVRPLPGERSLLWPWRLTSFLRGHAAAIVKQDVFGSPPGCDKALRSCARLLGPATWPVACVFPSGEAETADLASIDNFGFSGMQILALSGAVIKSIATSGHAIGSVFTDGFARYCVLGGVRPRTCDAPRASQAAQIYQQIEDALTRGGFVLPDIVRTWLFIDNILAWDKEFNEVRTEIFTENGLFSHLVPASTGVGAANPYGAAVLAGAWAMQPLDGSGLVITEVESPFQCSARKYGSCFSRAVAISGAGLERLLISGTASIEPGGRSVHPGDVSGQIQLTMKVVEEILRSRDMRWTDVSRAIVYLKHIADAPHYAKWCATHDVSLPALVLQADICREELLFEIEVDAIAIREEES